MLSLHSRKIIGIAGAVTVFVLGILALIFIEPFSAQWHIGLLFVMIGIVYFGFAIFLKNKSVSQ